MHFAGIPEPIRGFAAMKELGAAYFAAFPDLHVAVEHELADGDMVVHLYTWSATHQGELQGIPPTGKQVTVAGADAFRIEGSKIVEHWVYDDVMSLMQQLGVVPTPEQASV
jgi:predicted ester cyclase